MPSADHEYRRTCIKSIRCSAAQFYIPLSSLVIYDDVSYSGGAFSDIYRGTLREYGAVCLKVLRTHTQGKLRAERVIKSFCQEALIWRQVRHDSILPFLGVTQFVPWRLCLISPWMENGNIMTFLEKNPLHNRLGCVWDVAAGMQYLHSLDPCIIHKDIRGANILVGNDLHCYLADFGISLVLEETQMPGSSSRNRGNIRWLPPEMVLDSEFDPSLLREVDVYSFGCTIIEIYTGRPPYSDLRNDAAVINRLALRKVPSQPAPHILRPDLWNMTWSISTSIERQDTVAQHTRTHRL
ncbi:kinase-like protein [Hymenopellis radicata]|nr:kinase-like protein [Hymenopellis radicata]